MPEKGDKNTKKCDTPLDKDSDLWYNIFRTWDNDIAIWYTENGREVEKMLSVKEITALAERLERARAVVQTQAVYRVDGADNLFVVRNGDGNAFYIVQPGRKCSCKDFKYRLGKQGLPCKHLMAVELFNGHNGNGALERAEAMAQVERKARPRTEWQEEI